jgi:hypothetical protein
LQQEGNVIDERDGKLAGFERVRQSEHRRIFDPLRPGISLGSELPAQQVCQRPDRRCARWIKNLWPSK